MKIGISPSLKLWPNLVSQL